MDNNELKDFLDLKYKQYNRIEFIKDDPVSIPHMFSLKQDREISGLFAATLAWGQRKTIIQNSIKIVELMGGAPYDFILNHTENDLKPFETFVHRTFNSTDLLYFISFLSEFYKSENSLENAFTQAMTPEAATIGEGLNGFRKLFFSLDYAPSRTRKHISSPLMNSACKRLNMYLRWMVRKDDCGVDFGIWDKIKPSQLICPLDLHVHRVAIKLGLISRKQSDWKTAVELTEVLKSFCPEDPVRYDFALFGLGVEEKFK